MKWYWKKCQACGEEFASTVNNAKYCQKCRKKEYGKIKQRHKVTTLNDTEAMRQACLHCTRPSCNGACDTLIELSRSNT